LPKKRSILIKCFAFRWSFLKKKKNKKKKKKKQQQQQKNKTFLLGNIYPREVNLLAQ